MSPPAVIFPIHAPPAVLRRLRPADLLRFHSYRSDPAVARFQGWSPISAAEALAFIEEMASAEPLVPGAWFQAAIADAQSDELMGDLGLFVASGGDSGEVGFTLGADARGKGYATAAVKEAVAALFRHTRVGRVLGVTDARNTPSVRVLERAGFHLVESRETTFKGEPCTEWVYEIRQ